MSNGDKKSKRQKERKRSLQNILDQVDNDHDKLGFTPSQRLQQSQPLQQSNMNESDIDAYSAAGDATDTPMDPDDVQPYRKYRRVMNPQTSNQVNLHE